MGMRKNTLGLLLASAVLCMSQPAFAAPAATYSFDMPAQDLGSALRSVAARAGLEIYAAAGDVNGLPAPALKGTMSVREAIERLLADTGLSAHFDGGAVVIRHQRGASSETAADEIVVTGTHIRGAIATGPVISLRRDAITAAGQVDLGEAVRAIPQNFSGGQNPGVGTGAGSIVNENVNSGASINLRGLGPDATLTLLDGHRLPYDSAYGGVDISTIPVAAIERIEIVADGASAQYGSDAVAGVANVILRRDFRGVVTSARLGGATDGGYTQAHLDAVAGTSWEGGGALLAYDFARNTAIAARQRDYASALAPDFSLYPKTRRHALTMAAHQDVAPGIALKLDALYAKRWSTTAGGTRTDKYLLQPVTETFSINPELDLELGGGWRASARGGYGRDRTHLDTLYAPQVGNSALTTGCLCNEAISGEALLEGPLFTLAGGDARLALGAGYRDNKLDYRQYFNGSPSRVFHASRHSSFAYGELYLPFVSPAQELAGIERLSISAALRYEDYPGMAQLATPRLGLVYSPLLGLSLKGSWARSFKAPTLYQQYVSYQAYLLPAAAYGAGSADQTFLYASGGNPDLKPERARSWTAGFELAPPSLPALHMSASFFDIRYRNRVVQPISGGIGAALGDPGYASLIGFDPAPDTLAQVIVGAEGGLQNFSGLPYDPAGVVAIVDNRNRNVALQAIHGIDAQATWRQDLGHARSLLFDLAGTWLVSRQQVSDALPQSQLSGTLFNPPRLRLRASAQYEAQRFRIAAYANYTGKLVDRRLAAHTTIAASTTFDLSASYDLIAGAGPEPALSIALTANNLFNDKPPLIAQTGPTDTPYDSTNYSPIGRFLAVGIKRAW